MKRWQTVKAILYLTASVLIFIFNQSLMTYIGILVGAVVLLYAIEEIIVYAVKRTLFTDVYRLTDGVAQLIIGTVLFLVSSDVVKVCLVWGIWSVLRESKEFAEAVNNIKKRRLGIINAIESVVVIVLSFLLILEPNEEHARLHVYLLAAELMIVVLFYFAELLRDYIFKKKGIGKAKNGDSDKINELTV